MWELPFRNNVKSLSRALPGAGILDLGCGQGRIAEFFTSLGGRVTGIDIAPSPRWRGGGPGGPGYVCGNSESLPFRDDAFDIVVSCSTLQYVDHASVFREIIRVTRDGGVVLLHENMPYNPAILIYRLMRKAHSVFSSSARAYSSTITRYLTPAYPYPPAMHLENYRCYYLFSPLCFPLGARTGIGRPSILVGMVLRLDSWLLSRIPLLQKFCWFCSYTLSIRKPQPP